MLTLDSCLALANRNNVEIKTSQLEIERAQAVKAQVFTKYFPQVQLRGLAYYAMDPIIRFGIDDIQSSDMRELLQAIYELVQEGSDISNEIELMKRGATGSVVAAQPIFVGGRIVNGNRLARLGVEAAELQAEMKVRDVTENIESSYYLVVGLQQKVATVEAVLTLLDSLDRTVQCALDNGLVTRTDALQVMLKRNEMLALQKKLTSGIRLSKRLLCQQIGINYTDNLIFEDPVDAVPPLLDFSYTEHGDSLRPEMRLLQLNVEAEELRKSLTLGEALPQVALVGSAYYGNAIRRNYSGNAVALLTVSIPLSDWWTTAHKVQEHNIKIQEARLKQKQYDELMSLEEEKAYTDMVDAYLLLKSDSTAIDIASENYRLANINYEAGTTTLSEVLQAQAMLLQARNAITDRHTSYLMARRRLADLRKLGVGD